MCFTWPAIEALISDAVEDSLLPKNIGIFNVIWSAVAAATYFVGGAAYESLGRQSLFWLPGILYVVQLLVVICLGKNPVHAPPFVVHGRLACVGRYGTAEAAVPAFPAAG